MLYRPSRPRPQLRLADQRPNHIPRATPLKDQGLNLIPAGLALLARQPEAARSLVTHRFPIADINTAYQLMRSRTEPVGKVVMDLPAAR